MKRPALGFLSFVLGLCIHQAAAETVEYDLTIAETKVNFTGSPKHAIAVNGSIPAPTLTFREGDVARIHVKNGLNVEASVHWHGMLLPNRMDGVPFVTYPPIKPGETFDYEFPIRQHGTYWYHSHTDLQEQKGLYGAIRILPQSGAVPGDIDKTVVLSDWTDENPHEVLRWLKRGSEWPALERGTSQTLFGAIRVGKLGDFWKRELLRMPPMDLSDVAYDRFLANGEPEHRIAAKAGETLRVRLIDGSASTFFHLQFAGGPLNIVSADGQDVQPLEKERLLIGVAETYDVLLKVPEAGSYELRATAHDGSAWASIWIGEGERHPAPDVPHANLYHSMGKTTPAHIFALTPGGTMGMSDGKVDSGMFDHPGKMSGMMQMGDDHKMEMGDMPMPDGKKMMAMEAEGPSSTNPHDGKRHTWDFSPLGPDVSSRQPLAMENTPERPGPPYKELRSVENTALATNAPLREVRLTLDGDMERYVWSLDNRTLSESDSIKIARGETVRFIMVNRTMMNHPMHLHGHFFRVINGQGDHAPLKHTVIVPPMQTTVIEFAADEVGDWFFHCHLLYHMEGGMARVVHYQGFEPPPDTAAVRSKLYRDPFYFWGTADIMSHMTQGRLEFSNSRNIFMGEWEAGWSRVPDTEVETTFLYERYFNRFFRLFGGLNSDATLKTNPFDFDFEDTRGVFGFMYKLPLNIDTDVWVDTDGGARVRFAKNIPLTPRLMLGVEARFDTHRYWEERVLLDYMLHKNVSIIGQWHSDYGVGAGVRVRF
jgi:CopA family copper-resistance protein